MSRKHALNVVALMLVAASIITAAHADNLVYSFTISPHGNVPINSTVVLIAFTNDSEKLAVTFTWKNASLVTVFTDAGVPLIYNGTMYVANSTHTVDSTGGWTVNILFMSSLEQLTKECTAPRIEESAWFNVINLTLPVPEAPVLGTLGAATAMVLGLGLWLLKTRKSTLRPHL